jgi:hypothetical protein
MYVTVHCILRGFLNASCDAEELLPEVEKSVQFVGIGECLACLEVPCVNTEREVQLQIIALWFLIGI